MGNEEESMNQSCKDLYIENNMFYLGGSLDEAVEKLSEHIDSEVFDNFISEMTTKSTKCGNIFHGRRCGWISIKM